MDKVLRHFASAFSSSVDMPNQSSFHMLMWLRPVVLIFRNVPTDTFQEMEMPLLCFPREHFLKKRISITEQERKNTGQRRVLLETYK